VLLANGARIDYRGIVLRAPIPGVTSVATLENEDDDEPTE
jgi:hypothetical protein